MYNIVIYLLRMLSFYAVGGPWSHGKCSDFKHSRLSCDPDSVKTAYDIECNKCCLHAHNSFYFIPWWLGAESLNSNYMCKQSWSPYYCITEGLAQLACVNITLAATEEPLITVLCLKVLFCFTGFDSLLHKH